MFLSKLLDLPVSSSDIFYQPVSQFENKFHTVESLTSLAKAGYDKAGQSRLVLPSSSVMPQAAKKRTKDTSGMDASPHTVQARPLAKRYSMRRWLAFPPCE